MQSAFPKLSFVLGGASCGKSAFAESVVRSSGCRKIYVATAQAFDDEMRSKIIDHKAQRGPDWIVKEAPLTVPEALADAEYGDIVLVDCLTLWLSNHMLADNPTERLGADLLAAVTACAAPVVLVSNEVGQGIVPDTRLGRQFRSAQGRLNQEIAAQADVVVFVTAGLPMVLKGSLP